MEKLDSHSGWSCELLKLNGLFWVNCNFTISFLVFEVFEVEVGIFYKKERKYVGYPNRDHNSPVGMNDVKVYVRVKI